MTAHSSRNQVAVRQKVQCEMLVQAGCALDKLPGHCCHMHGCAKAAQIANMPS